MIDAISHPADEILETMIGGESRFDTTVEDLIDFVLEFAVDFYGRGRGIGTVGNSVGGIWF